MAKSFAKSFYKSARWQETRQAILMRDGYICRRCGKLAEEVHHVVRLNQGNIDQWEVALNPENLESLCSDCHKAEHLHDRMRGLGQKPKEDMYYIDSDGYTKKKILPP